MHGYVRPVERKIRLWIAQQERDHLEEAQLSRFNVRTDATVENVRRPRASQPREQLL